jgi:uncharacterized protein with GYD domain
MAKYLAMFSYSDEAMAAMVEHPTDREGAVRTLLDHVGARLESFYWMFGAADGIAVVEAPDSVTMAAISTAIRSTGTVRSETHVLFGADEVHRILETARDARATFTTPGS